jgi:hypothetical protein
LVVKVNWACTTTGSVNNNSSSGSSLTAQVVLKRTASAFELVVFAIELLFFMFCLF